MSMSFAYVDSIKKNFDAKTLVAYVQEFVEKDISKILFKVKDYSNHAFIENNVYYFIN